MPPAEFEPGIPAGEQPQTHATEIGTQIRYYGKTGI
jgi:hypothetical protein